MKLLVSFVARQTVVQSAVVKEADPDYILFICTPVAAENGWHEKIPLIVNESGTNPVPYTCVFITEGITLSMLIETVKRHLHLLMKDMTVTEFLFDASSGKGIHRITVSEYLKSLAEKKKADFFMIYFDPDTRKIDRIHICKSAISEHRSNVTIDWTLHDRLTLTGAVLTEVTDILTDSADSFRDCADQYDELYRNLCSSMVLRAFFSSYDNIKSIVDDPFSSDVKFSMIAFNRFRQKYVKELEKEGAHDTRSQISMIFEKIVSYAVYKAVMENRILRGTIASVHQNVKLDGKTSSLIEIDTLVMFKNGYIHIFETKSSHAANKDINSKILVLKRYLGESTGMDIVFPFTASDIAGFKEKNGKFLRAFHNKGLKNVSTWMNFFTGTDKTITPLDKIGERLVEIALRYN